MTLLDKVKLKVLRRASVRRVLLPFLSVSQNRWVFIVGCYNSGTTLLQRLVAAHPAVDQLPLEGVALTRELPRPELFGHTRMWYKCREKIELGRYSQGPDPVLIKKEWGLWLKPGKVAVEKSIANSARMPWIDKYFDSPHFISIVRNGYCAAEGIRRRSRLGKFPMDHSLGDCARQWAASVDTIDRDASLVGNFHEVQYERLADDPASVMKELFHFLELPHLDIASYEQGVQIGQARFNVLNMNSKSLGALSAREIEEIAVAAGDALERKGYGRP